MNADKVLYEVGTMLHRNAPRGAVKVDTASAKERFNIYVRCLANGYPIFEMTAEDIHALADGRNSGRHDKLPKDIVQALGLWPGSDYSDAFFAAHDARKDYKG